jgi:DNA-binding transcriptional regulator GbsR (MarR family)|tara:strand:+ start:837 stop:1244 length:408 start_codon:yes stop_codon:yes gene_type:complete
MELLYFISGILSVGVIYGILLLRTVKSSHTDLLARHQSQSNISSIRFSEVVDDMDSLNILVQDIQSGMEKDQYESLAKINADLKKVSELAQSTNTRLSEANRVFTKNASDAFTEIQQVRNNLKVAIQGPNMTSQY